MIFDILLGKPYGKFHCPFHEGDDTASLSISSEGLFHCFACGASGGGEIDFIKLYFNVDYSKAKRLYDKLNNIPQYRYDPYLSQQDINYLTSIGISNKVQKLMMKSSTGKLIYPHTYKGVEIDHTWFNYPGNINHNINRGKYSRDFGSVSGFLTPYQYVLNRTVYIVEGEKDMLTLLSHNIKATSIVGGAQALPHFMQQELKGKNVVIIYDCDKAGREGAEKLTHFLYAIGVNAVKNVDLGLQDKEDINDWFVKYKFTRKQLIDLINATPVAKNIDIKSLKVLNTYKRIINTLDENELEELKLLLEKEDIENVTNNTSE